MFKVVIIGPESTGKSTLCENLAVHYNSIWVREYAREYLLKNGATYTFPDLLTVAKGQLEAERAAAHEATNLNAPLIIDTDMYVMKVWCEFVFERCHNWILDQIVNRKYDLYLLCNIDLPWVKDELREYPDLESREKLYHMYRQTMLDQNVPWIEVNGSYEERLQKAIAAIDELYK